MAEKNLRKKTHGIKTAVRAEEDNSKRMKKVCTYGEKCYRRNPTHFRDYSHAHLEAILDEHSSGDEFTIPHALYLQRQAINEQLKIIVEHNFYTPIKMCDSDKSSTSKSEIIVVCKSDEPEKFDVEERKDTNADETEKVGDMATVNVEPSTSRVKDTDYRPVVLPTRKIEGFFNVVTPKGGMAKKHERNAPFYIFYTTITASKETHTQDNSITFQEILDHSLGELKCSLQINFMVDIGWLLAQYYFAGYSKKKLTILYGDDCSGGMAEMAKKKTHVDAHLIKMATPFGVHHTKMMILCYKDGSLRVLISTANLYTDDWENRTQGLWFSPKCGELPEGSMPHEGDSPTGFKRSLLTYLNYYKKPELAYYIDRVKSCDFSHINVFLVASAPGSHFDANWGMVRVGALLRQHCAIPPQENHQWELVAQASSIGSYGKQPELWLTGAFLGNFTKTPNQSPLVSPGAAKLRIVYPSLDNVKQSHDGLLGGGCLPYSAESHSKQNWLTKYMCQWKATSTHRDRAMPHLKCYMRTSSDGKKAAYYILTSGNISKGAWGTINKTDAALRMSNYEIGVLFLPRFVTNNDFFSLDKKDGTYLPLAYDLPLTPYEKDTSPWVMDYLYWNRE